MALDLEIFVSILIVYALVVISPGPNFVLVTRYALRHSGGLAFAVTIGLAIGATVNASLTMFGVGVLIVAYPLFGVAVSLLGGGFLVFLGISAIFVAMTELKNARLASGGATHTTDLDADSDPAEASSSKGMFEAGQKGFWVNLLNPKGIAFFIGLYAPLIAKASLNTKVAVLIASFSIELVWYGIVIAFLTRPVVRQFYDRSTYVFEITMGIILNFLGLRVIYEARDYLELWYA